MKGFLVRSTGAFSAVGVHVECVRAMQGESELKRRMNVEYLNLQDSKRERVE